MATPLRSMTLACAAAAGLSGCALRFGHGADVRLGVPMVRQEGEGAAGLASARMLARYYGLPLEPRAERLMRLASSSGELTLAELAAALEASGYRVVVFSGTLGHGESGLYTHLDRGEPVVVEIESTYMLLEGYGDGQVRLLDPKHGPLRVAADDFDRAWSDSSRYALIARH